MQAEDCDDRIITGASELFRMYGIKSVTMDTIAQHLGISKRTIYEKFKDKDELLFAVMNCMMYKQKEKIENFINTSPNVIEALFRLIGLMHEHIATMNPLINSDLRKYHSHVMLRIHEQCEFPESVGSENIVVRGKEQGVFREEINNDIVTRCMSGLAKMISDRNLFPPEKYSQRDIVKNVVVNYLRGITTPEGLKIINELEPEL